MLKKSVYTQIKILLNQKLAIITFFLMLILVLYNYFNNIYINLGKDVIELFQPMLITTISGYKNISFYFMQYFPFMVILPASFSYMLDKSANTTIFLELRVGKKYYYIGKVIAVFLVTFLVFTIPLLLEILLNLIAFPIQANGDPNGFPIYSDTFISTVDSWFLPSLYVISPVLYTVTFTIIFGLVCGLLSVFTLAISTLDLIKFKIILFIPIYLLFILLIFIESFFSLSISTNYIDYIRIFSNVNLGGGAYISVLCSLLLVSLLIIAFKARKDSL
ncbi:MAG: hypothetical protein R3Y35_09005 [Clostridia bacterium]